MRIVKDQINPGGSTFAAGSDQCSIVGRSESHFEKRIRQPALGIHSFIEPDEAAAHLEGVFEWHGELQLLMEMVDSSVESLVTLHDKVGTLFDAVSYGR